MVDEIRRKLMSKQNLVYDHQRQKNRIVSDFLFKDIEESKGGGGMKFSEDGDKDKSEDESEDDEDRGFGNAQPGKKPNSHNTLDYRHWRLEIIPAIRN